MNPIKPIKRIPIPATLAIIRNSSLDGFLVNLSILKYDFIVIPTFILFKLNVPSAKFIHNRFA